MATRMRSSICMLLAMRSSQGTTNTLKNAKCIVFRLAAEQVPLVTYVFEMEPRAAL
jgi:hypothetical protein